MGGGHLQCKVMDAFFSVLLQIFVNTGRYILSVEVLHWSSHQLMTSTSAGIKFLMLLVRKYLVLVDVFCITLFVCIWLLVELQYSGNKHVTFMMPLDLSFVHMMILKSGALVASYPLLNFFSLSLFCVFHFPFTLHSARHGE